MLGQSYLKLYPSGEAQEMARHRLAGVLAQGEANREREDFRKDGSRVWTEARSVRTVDAHGNPSGVISIYHDITARRQSELERHRLEQQLLQAQKMDTMGTLAGGIAHDFNNIIATIMGYTELALLMDQKDPRIRTMQETVLKSAHRARDLVKRILTFSRFHEPERKPVYLGEIIRETVRFMRATIPATIELRLELGENLPLTLADPNQIHQLIVNLATNAAYAMRAHGGLLTIRLSTVTIDAPHPTTVGSLSSGTYFALEVADTGHGIDAETLKKIFDPFFTTKPVGEGTGLGLPIVHGITQGHGGSIDVTSQPGMGTTFKIFLPFVEPAERDAGATMTSAGSIPRGTGQRIAVIDDEEDVGKATQITLHTFGYDVSRFRSAEEFYAECFSLLLQFDLIVTDQTMPHLTGLELARRLRASGHTIPILLVSGYSAELTPAAVADLAPAESLKKPYESQQLAIAVNRLLSTAAVG
jgi:signal transduction histidine kinase/CheY-like chemotaxis protein